MTHDDRDLALKEVEAVIADDPDNAKAHGAAGFYKLFLGRSEEGFADVETALRLSPNDNEAPTWLAHLCYLQTKLAQWEQAIEWCEKAMRGGHSGEVTGARPARRRLRLARP